MSHIIESCSLTTLNGGLSPLHSVDEDAVLWRLVMVDDTHTRRRRSRILDVEQTDCDESSREQPPCKRTKGETEVFSFLASLDDEQDGAEPASRP